jgi:hypothetical protein
MGFRSTVTSDVWYGTLPAWFQEKYMTGNFPMLRQSENLPLSSANEVKAYFHTNFDTDVQKAILEMGHDLRTIPFVFVWLHECGGITRVEIWEKNIFYSEPATWCREEWITHDYCYGCSEAGKGV